jgi:hypothetical protein
MQAHENLHRTQEDNIRNLASTLTRVCQSEIIRDLFPSVKDPAKFHVHIFSLTVLAAHGHNFWQKESLEGRQPLHCVGEVVVAQVSISDESNSLDVVKILGIEAGRFGKFVSSIRQHVWYPIVKRPSRSKIEVLALTIQRNEAQLVSLL